MPDITYYETEQAAWDDLWGPTHKNKRARLRRGFNKLFPKGHQTSIRSFVNLCADGEMLGQMTAQPRGSHLSQIHPDAFSYIARYGVDYHPITWRRPSPAATDNECFVNAWCFMEASHRLPEHACYVEGMVIDTCILPTLHAWNALYTKPTRAIDVTYSATCAWTRYLGIPFTRDEHREIRGKSAGPLFSTNSFTRMREKIGEVLARREEHPLAPAA